MAQRAASIHLEEVTTVESLEELRPEWVSLWERCPAATPFQSPEWLLTWWRHFGGNILWVLTLRSRGRLVGIAPFSIHHLLDHKRRQISFIGAGITDYLDLLLEPGLESEGLDLWLDYLVQERSRWDVCDLRDIRPDSPLLRAKIPSSLKCRMTSPEACSVLPLPDEVGKFNAALHAVCRMRLQRARTLLEKSGGIRVEIADEETLPEFLDTLFRLHRARWLQRNLSGVLSRYDVQAFHWEAASGLLKRGCLRLYVMKCGDAVTAALYTFARGDRVYCYLGGFDPEMSRLNPGMVLTGYAIEDAIRNGSREFDFLKGNENYKYIWGARDRMVHRLLLWHASPGSRTDGPEIF